jgi:hypothetical protein
VILAHERALGPFLLIAQTGDLYHITFIPNYDVCLCFGELLFSSLACRRHEPQRVLFQRMVRVWQKVVIAFHALSLP